MIEIDCPTHSALHKDTEYGCLQLPYSVANKPKYDENLSLFLWRYLLREATYLIRIGQIVTAKKQ